MPDARSRSTTPLGTSKTFSLSNDIQCLHFVNISVMNYFAEKYFNSDLSRVVYASNAYAFRRRVEQAGKDSQGLALPFMNLKIMNVQPGSRRPWKNMSLEAGGHPDYNIANKLRMTPITITYDMTMFFSTEIESLFTMSKAIWESATETKITSSIDISYRPDMSQPASVVTFDNIGVLSYDGLAYNTEFNESEWLQKNKIRAIPVNPTLETWLWKTPIGAPSPTVSITKEFILRMYENNAMNFVDNLIETVDYLEGST